MAADLAISIATPFIEYLIEPIGRQCGYILFYRRYLRELEQGVDKLKDELEGIEHQCQAARRNSMNIEKKATKWIDDVNVAVKEANALLLLRREQPAGAANQSWFKRCVCLDHPPVTLSQQADQASDAIPSQNVDLTARKKFYLNPVVRYKKGRKAKKTMIVIQGLNEDKKNLGEISYEASTTPILSLKDYQSFRSREEIVYNIIKALSDTKAPAIGVWGMGGVGKSTLMKEIIRLAREKNLFDDVAMVDVSQNPDVKKIQGELASWLDLKFKDDENVSVRAACLHKRLKPTDKMKGTAESLKMQNAIRPEENQDGRAFVMFPWKKSTAAPEPVEEGRPEVKQKQVLIILDNIWRGLDLEEIGIPLDGGAVKLLFTSRKQHVLLSEMNCSQNVFKLEVLNGGEPWRLFESIVGEIVTSDSRFRSIGEEVVQKCSGLPIVIKAIATTLRNRSLQEWEDALIQFKGSKDAYSNLEISYKHLESEELKSLFLVCALTNDAYISVQDLLYYSMGLGLLTGTNTVRSARNKLKALLHDLQDSSLLLKDDDQDPDYVRIHDVVREVAIRIASRDQHSHLITDELELKKISKEKVKNSKAISIPYVKFQKLPEGWECPELKMFLLYRREDDPPIGISDSFFKGMKELSVLDISGRCFDSLPSSIQLLLNLNTLCLDRCSIEDLTLIGKLKQLQILSFIGSEIARLPKELGELSELKVLNLTNSKLEVIEHEVLGKLTSLEELHLKGSSFIRWEDERETQPKNAKLSELNNLCNLSIVNIHIHNPSTIPNNLEFGNLVEYIIQIGDVWDWTGDYKESRMLKIKLELCRSSFLHEKWVQDLLKRTQNLHLDGIKGWLIRSFHELCLDGFQELKHLYLENSSLVQCVARSVSNWSPCTAFTVLESLILENLSGLERIKEGPVTANSFSKLKFIMVIDCGKLKSLFSHSMLKCLSQLEDIEVRDCEAMQVIVAVDSVATNTEAVKLEALHRIKLHNLPNFMRFCSSHKVEVGQTEELTGRISEIVQQDLCIPTSCTMFSNDQLVSFPLLKSLILSNLPKLKHIWQYNYCPIEVADLEYLEVCSCDDMLVVIPSSLVKEVTKLETLIVRDCGSLQELFETIDGDALNLTSDVEILSRLNKLELSNLPFLRHLWENNHQVRAFQNLNLLKVVDCSSLMNLLPAALLKSLNQLTEIYIKSCKEMKALFPLENDGRAGETKNIEFQSLVEVWLEDLPNMVTVVWTEKGESINFLSLKGLYVINCPKMRSFSLLKEDESYHDEICFFDDKVQFPKLAGLCLASMGSIRTIWHEEIVEQSFCQLEILLVQHCQTLVDVIPSFNMTGGVDRLQFHNLKDININHCTSFEGPLFKFAVEETGNEGYCSLPQLEKLKLFELPKLKHVVQPDSHVVAGFPSLVDLIVADCQCLADVFPISTAATLSKLEDLQVCRCNSMRQIFGKDEEDDEMLKSILFPYLRSIAVQDLDSLISFFSGITCMLGFPSLETIDISWCSKLETFVQRYTTDQTLEQSFPFTKSVHCLFDDKVLVPNVVKLDLVSVGSIEKIWHEEIFEESVFQLESLIVRDCQNLVKIFPTNYVTRSLRLRFQNLQTIVIRECSSLEGSLFEFVWVEKKGNQVFSLPQLEKIWLYDLPKLEHVIHPTSDVVLEFQSLVQISIADCQCLIDVFPSAKAAILSKLEDLQIQSCSSMRYVFGKEAEEEDDEILLDLIISFPCLRTIAVQNLNSLICFFLGIDCQFDFPSLEALEISSCLVLKTFVQRHKSEDIHYLFDEKVLFPKVVKLDLMSVGSIEKIWHEEIFEESFFLLESLIVQDCQNLVKVFPTNYVTRSLLLRFQNLQTIIIRECSSLEGSLFEFVWEEEEKRNQVFSVPQLEKLWLYDLPKLEHVLHPTSDVVLEFQSLVEISIKDCQCLIDLLPSATAATLSKLEDVQIQSCSSMRYVFGKEAEEEDDEILLDLIISFPCLRSIAVQNLDSLICFFLGTARQFDFPSLEDLQISSCPLLKTFVQRNKSEDIHYLFDEKVLVPKVVKLSLFSVGSIEKIWHEEIFEESCFQLNIFQVMDLQNLVKVFPSKYVTRTQRLLLFQNLKTIIIGECSSLEGSLFEFVWKEEEDKGKLGFSLPLQLEQLWLFDLPKLEHVVHPTSDVALECQSLVDISIADCPCLIDLFPCATAATLSKLEKVTILRCSRMRYVFGKEEAEEKDEMSDLITFPCLCTITVQNLNSMICFFLGTDCHLDFPSLEDLQISCCPVLKTFVQRHKSEDVHYLFDHKVDFPNLQKMKFIQLGSLQTLWKNELLPSTESCTRLKSLDVWDCKDLQHIFPASFAFAGDRNKKPLERLTAEDGELVICFRELEHLDLSNLPNLKSFSSANCTLEFPSLEQVTVTECPNLEVFSSSSVLAPKLSNVLFDEETGSVRWDGDLNTTIQNLPKS